MIYAEIIGRATADAVEKVSENGKVLRRFSVATDRGFGSQKQTDFVNCVLFAPLLDNGWRHITKGKLMYVRGHMASYKDRKDERITHWQCVVRDVEFLSVGSKNEGSKHFTEERQQTSVPPVDVYDDEFMDDFE